MRLTKADRQMTTMHMKTKKQIISEDQWQHDPEITMSYDEWRLQSLTYTIKTLQTERRILDAKIRRTNVRKRKTNKS